MATSFHDIVEGLQEQIGRSFAVILGQVDSRQTERLWMSVGRFDVMHLPRTTVTEVVPPLYASSIMEWSSGVPEAKLNFDGTSLDQIGGLSLGGLRLMGVGQDLEFLAQIETGMELIQETTIEDVQLKTGKSGDLAVISIRRVFKNNGQDMLRCTETFIGR